MGSLPAIDLLREKIRRLEAADRRISGVLPFGLAEMDARLPGGGLALGALHEVAGADNGALGIAIRRWWRQRDAADFGQPTAAVTRWRVSVLPSAPLAAPGIGRRRWLAELLRCRAGESADFEVEGCDHEGRLALSAGLADQPAAAGAGRVLRGRA